MVVTNPCLVVPRTTLELGEETVEARADASTDVPDANTAQLAQCRDANCPDGWILVPFLATEKGCACTSLDLQIKPPPMIRDSETAALTNDEPKDYNNQLKPRQNEAWFSVPCVDRCPNGSHLGYVYEGECACIWDTYWFTAVSPAKKRSENALENSENDLPALLAALAQSGSWEYATSVNGFTRFVEAPKRQAEPPITLQTQAVVNQASMLFAVELAGSFQSETQFDYFCDDFPLDAMRAFGINVTLFHQTLCENRDNTNIPLPPAATSDAIAVLSTRIWILQALGAFRGNYQMACDAFDVEGAAAYSLNGTYAKNIICNAAINATTTTNTTTGRY